MKKNYFILFSIVLIISLFFMLAETLGFCDSYGAICRFAFEESYTYPLLILSLSILVPLSFLSEKAMEKWFRIMWVYVVVYVIAIYSVPVLCDFLFCFTKQNTSWILSILFLLISIIIAFVKRKPKVVS